MNKRTADIIIVGAGLTGLSLAQSLKTLGKSCLILEKSRGLGGRVATRRIDGLGLDHGAPFLFESKLFEDFLKIQTPEGFFIKGGMNQIAKSLADGLEILKSQKVNTITNENAKWLIETEEGLGFECRDLIITAPLPQANLLLKANNLVEDELKAYLYKKALILLATAKNIPPSMRSSSFGGHKFFFMRERDLHPDGIVFHLSDDLAEAYFEKTDEEILQRMRHIFHLSPMGFLEIEKEEVKKWRYSRPLSFYPAPYHEVKPGLFVTGDGFSGAMDSANNLVQVLRSLA